MVARSSSLSRPSSIAISAILAIAISLILGRCNRRDPPRLEDRLPSYRGYPTRLNPVRTELGDGQAQGQDVRRSISSQGIRGAIP